MMTSMHIKNFKCFKDFEVKDLGRVNLIGGQNNIGKTALLEALWLFFGFPKYGLTRISASRYFDSKEPFDPDEIWGGCFFGKDHASTMSISSTINAKTTLLSISWIDVFNPLENPNFQNALAQQNPQKQFMPDANSKMLLMEYSAPADAKKQKSIWQEMFYSGTYMGLISRDNPVVPLEHSTPFLIRSNSALPYADIKVFFEKLLEKGTEKNFIQFLQKIDPRIKAVMVYKKTLMLDLEGGILNRVPLHYLGDGLQRAMLYYLVMANLHANFQGGVILIDEIENGLHYSIMQTVFSELEKAAKEFNCQVFATTHSRECLQAAHEGFKDCPEDLRYIRLNRLKDDIISTVYSTEGFARSIDHEWELR